MLASKKKLLMDFSDSDDANIRRTEARKTLAIDPETERENNTRGAEECSFVFAGQWTRNNVSQKVKRL